MATLVLSSVGQALGGPLGQAVGALVGQQIDQRLFAGPGHEGPRLGDLSVQGSRYGAVIPAVHGRMRVAGTIIWATELEESQVVTGAKGQGDRTTYSYSANFAVALSSKPGASVGRIWADGRLLRGALGDLKVGGLLRIHNQGELQDLDPLIGSIEAAAPAYRDMMVAVFEGLELAEYGNRIPMLTFEVIAEGDMRIGALIEAASEGLVTASGDEVITGYALHGTSMERALEPLLALAGMALSDRGGRLDCTSPANPIKVGSDEEGCGAEAPVARRIDQIVGFEQLPSDLFLDHYDPDRDFQAGRSHARAVGGRRVVELPVAIALKALDARSWAERSILKRWRERRSIEISLPPSFLTLTPGDLLEFQGETGQWRVIRVRLEGFVVKARIVAHATSSAMPSISDSGRFLPVPDFEQSKTEVTLIEPPDLDGSGKCCVLVAAASASPGWRATPLEIEVGAMQSVASSAALESVTGFVDGTLGTASAAIFDLENVIHVNLVEPNCPLLSVEDQQLFAGANLAMIGGEVLQFGNVEQVAPGRVRLSRLLRGRDGSETAIAGHGSNEAFILLDPARLAKIDMSPEQVGNRVAVRATSTADADAAPSEIIFRGLGSRPISPAHLRARKEDGAIHISWVRRSRKGYAWLDEVDAPLGESRELYLLTVSGTSGAFAVETSQPIAVFSADDISPLGEGALNISCAMVGDWGRSTAVTIVI
ncbi:phage tail protein [Sphingomicrobium arenosum]|uniref:phage tail protein n=1 Tax=Sphingomicrobium arenosum TaxID=2233861 RepID=UPI00223FB88A|nr:phage tail protein [Sphingomicrobium arenosum]